MGREEADPEMSGGGGECVHPIHHIQLPDCRPLLCFVAEQAGDLAPLLSVGGTGIASQMVICCQHPLVRRLDIPWLVMRRPVLQHLQQYLHGKQVWSLFVGCTFLMGKSLGSSIDRRRVLGNQSISKCSKLFASRTTQSVEVPTWSSIGY